MPLNAVNSHMNGPTLADFDRLSRGKFNAGAITLGGSGGLKVVNRHVTMTFLNTTKLDRFQVFDVKTAFVNALRDSGLSTGRLEGIRARLGIPSRIGVKEDLGEIEKLAAKPLTRQEVRDILREFKAEIDFEVERKAQNFMDDAVARDVDDFFDSAKGKKWLETQPKQVVDDDSIESGPLPTSHDYLKPKVARSFVRNDAKYKAMYNDYMDAHGVKSMAPGTVVEENLEIGRRLNEATGMNVGTRDEMVDRFYKGVKALFDGEVGSHDARDFAMALKAKLESMPSGATKETMLKMHGIHVENDTEMTGLVITKRFASGHDISVTIPDMTMAQLEALLEEATKLREA